MMITDQKPLVRGLRRSHTSTPPSTPSSSHSSSSSSWIQLRSVLFVVASLSPVSHDRGNLRSPWSNKRRKHVLLPKQWKSLFGSDGKLCDCGVKFLKKVRSGGVDPSIRAEVWPFLLGVYGLDSSNEERGSVRNQMSENTPFLATGEIEKSDVHANSPPSEESRLKSFSSEDFASWQRIIRLDAARANDEWVIYSPAQAAVSNTKARKLAERVGSKDYDNLEPCRIYHAARLVAILEAYALHDPEIGYCQGMSDLLSPIISVIEEDDVAFWCFAGFMRKARYNFQLDEVGIRR
ncbi:hypothetical protein Ancab_033310 [Ancistrocladus abbreviatus]